MLFHLLFFSCLLHSAPGLPFHFPLIVGSTEHYCSGLVTGDIKEGHRLLHPWAWWCICMCGPTLPLEATPLTTSRRALRLPEDPGMYVQASLHLHFSLQHSPGVSVCCPMVATPPGWIPRNRTYRSSHQ